MEVLEMMPLSSVAAPVSLTYAKWQHTRTALAVREFVNMFNNARYLRREDGGYYVAATDFAMTGICREGGFEAKRVNDPKAPAEFRGMVWFVKRPAGQQVTEWPEGAT